MERMRAVTRGTMHASMPDPMRIDLDLGGWNGRARWPRSHAIVHWHHSTECQNTITHVLVCYLYWYRSKPLPSDKIARTLIYSGRVIVIPMGGDWIASPCHLRISRVHNQIRI